MFTEVTELPKLIPLAQIFLCEYIYGMSAGFLSGPPVNASRYTHFSFLPE